MHPISNYHDKCYLSHNIVSSLTSKQDVSSFGGNSLFITNEVYLCKAQTRIRASAVCVRNIIWIINSTVFDMNHCKYSKRVL